MADRLTDEAWQQMLHAGEAPDPPLEWAGDFLCLEATETVSQHLSQPVEWPMITGVRLELGEQAVNSGDMLEASCAGGIIYTNLCAFGLCNFRAVGQLNVLGACYQSVG